MNLSAARVKSLLSRGWKRVQRRLSRPRERTKIALGNHSGCSRGANCTPFATRLCDWLAGGPYEWPASILFLEDHATYLAEHRTARKRAGHSRRLGYVAQPVNLSQRLDEMHAINTSLPERQGRPMTVAYRKPPERSPLPTYPCTRHQVQEWGVLSPDGTLVAYLVLHVCGELAIVMTILGHGDHLQNDVMYLLVLGALEHVPMPTAVFYSRHDSGGEGLRYFKERLGFVPTRVEWAL